MKINNDSRLRINVTMTTTVDPADATLELRIDDTWYPCEWTAAATAADGEWTRPARTTRYFAGHTVPTADLDGATVLTAGQHQTETRVKWTGGDTIVDRAEPIKVT